MPPNTAHTRSTSILASECTQKAAKHSDGEAKSRLTLDFVGVGLLAPRHRGEDDDDDGGGEDDDDDERR